MGLEPQGVSVGMAQPGLEGECAVLLVPPSLLPLLSTPQKLCSPNTVLGDAGLGSGGAHRLDPIDTPHFWGRPTGILGRGRAGIWFARD